MSSENPPPEGDPQAPQYGSQPPSYGSQPPSYGSQPPQYGSQPPQYGSTPSGSDPNAGQTPPSFGSPPPPPPFGGDPGAGGYGTPPPPPYGGQPGPGGFGPPPANNQKVIIAFITSILGILLCICCYGIFAFAGGGTAVYLAMQAEKEGAPNANIAKILGFVAIGLGVVGLILGIVGAAVNINRFNNF